MDGSVGGQAVVVRDGRVYPGDPRPEESPEVRGAAGERNRHPAPGEG